MTGVLCGTTAGIGCIVAVGLAAGAGLAVANHYISHTRGGLLDAVEKGVIGGPIKVGESGAIYYGGKKFALDAKTFFQLGRALLSRAAQDE